MHAKLTHFPSLQSKLVWSKPRRLRSLTAREEQFESYWGDAEGERGILISPDP